MVEVMLGIKHFDNIQMRHIQFPGKQKMPILKNTKLPNLNIFALPSKKQKAMNILLH